MDGESSNWHRKTALRQSAGSSSSPPPLTQNTNCVCADLIVSRRYRVTFDNSGQSSVVDGFLLMEQGITLRLEGALTSELLVIVAV